MDPLIAHVKKRVTGPLRTVDASTWVCPMPSAAPPATPALVGAAEATLGSPSRSSFARCTLRSGMAGLARTTDWRAFHHPAGAGLRGHRRPVGELQLGAIARVPGASVAAWASAAHRRRVTVLGVRGLPSPSPCGCLFDPAVCGGELPIIESHRPVTRRWRPTARRGWSERKRGEAEPGAAADGHRVGFWDFKLTRAAAAAERGR